MAKTAKRSRQPTSEELHKALGYTLRSEILTILSKQRASPSELRKMLRVDLRDVSYHVKRLVELNCIELVEEVKVRGATKSVYRSTVRNFVTKETAEAMHPAVADHYAGQVWREISGDVKQAAEAGTLDTQGEIFFNCRTLDLDQEGHAEAYEAYAEFEERLLAIAASSADRVAEGEETSRPFSSGLLYFELPSKTKPL